MNASALPLSNNTPLCYSINSPPFNYHPTIASAYFSSIFSTLGLISNLIAFVVLFKSFCQTHSHSRSFFLIFLGGLVVTHLMGLLVTGSIAISFRVTHFNWRTVDPNCHFCNFMGMSMVFYGLCPLLLSAAMSVVHFIGINRPFACSASMPKSWAISMVLTVWLIAGCIALLPLTGIGSYHIKFPGSWCFFNISSKGNDLAFSLLFSLVGLMSLTMSFVLNTVSVVTLIKVCCRQDRNQRHRDNEVEIMVHLILIIVICSVCWCPILIFIAQTVLSKASIQVKQLLLRICFATWNQIVDLWVYILFHKGVLKRIYPCLSWSWGSIMTSYPSFSDTVHRFTCTSLETLGSDGADETEKSSVMAPSTLKPSPPSS
uniref:thromboxane A2 receptor-like n=1 Tax=Monopterus albus TaxID=43700 RepID=UPI0009B4984D|nr:thromboxane A2 receptor-like [Monopterus albus]